MAELLLHFFKSSYAGIDFNLDGNGGFECYDYLSLQSRLIDTCVFTAFVLIIVIPRTIRTLSLPKEWEIISYCRKRSAQRVCGFRKLLLIILSIVLGVEIGYKIAEQSWIFLLNPCHVVTAIQIYLLSAEPSRTCTAIFRVHIHLLFGAFLAFVFPILNTRNRHGEQMIYYFQHLLITFIVPPYLIHTGGAYRCEPLPDFSWVLVTMPLFGFHMYYILQATSMLTLVNMNNMLCPAVSDPFAGPNYRWFAMFHQTALLLIFGKLYTLVAYSALKLYKVISRQADDDVSKKYNNHVVDSIFDHEQSSKNK